MAGLLKMSQKHVKMGIVSFTEKILLNNTTKLYIGQRIVLKAFYGEQLDPEEQAVMDSWQLPTEDKTTWVKDRKYVNMIVECGRRGSKSTLASAIVLYEFFNLINMENPSEHYGLIPGDPIDIFVIAKSMDQVKETLFAKVVGYAQGSTYFKSLEQKGIISIQTTKITCPKKNVTIYAKHTNSGSLVGYSLKLLVLDEASRFEDNEMGDNMADEIYENVGRACRTFGDEGRKLMISSAWKIGDPIERYYKLAKRDPYTLGFRLTTFDLNLNPRFARDSPAVVSDYNAKPELARLEYEGIRSSKYTSYISKDNLEIAARGRSVIDASIERLDIKVGEDKRHYVGVRILRLESDIRITSFGHLDYGEKKDAAAFAFGHGELIDGEPIVVIDGLLHWKPQLDETGIRTVSFTDVEEALIKVCRARNIQKLTFDSWQSTGTVQRLHMQGVNTDVLSSSRDNQLTYYTVFNNLNNAGKIILPQDSLWTANMLTEMSSLVLLPNNKIVHPSAPKDIADAVCLSVWNIYQHMITTGMINRESKVGVQSVRPTNAVGDRRTSINRIQAYRNNHLC